MGLSSVWTWNWKQYVPICGVSSDLPSSMPAGMCQEKWKLPQFPLSPLTLWIASIYNRTTPTKRNRKVLSLWHDGASYYNLRLNYVQKLEMGRKNIHFYVFRPLFIRLRFLWIALILLYVSILFIPFWNPNDYQIFQNLPATYQEVICIMGVYLLPSVWGPEAHSQYYFQGNEVQNQLPYFSSLYKIPLSPWVLHRDYIYTIGATPNKKVRHSNHS